MIHFLLSMLLLTPQVGGPMLPGPGVKGYGTSPGTSPSMVSGQVCHATTAGTGVSTLTCNLPVNITAGNGVVIYASICCSSGVTPSATDGPSDTFSIPTGCSNDFDTIASPSIFTKVWMATNSVGGSNSITVNFTGTNATFTEVTGVEIQNVPTSGAVDGSCQTAAQDSGTTVPSVTLTSSTTNEYGIAFGMIRATGVTVTAGSGYTHQYSDSFSAGTTFMQDQSLATASGYTTTWTDDAGTTRRNVIALVIK